MNITTKVALACLLLLNIYSIRGDQAHAAAEVKDTIESFRARLTDPTKFTSETEDAIEELRKELKEVARHVMELELQRLPIGFIYMQISPNPSPVTMFPHLSWADVTASYPGYFFRAAGGDSGAYGALQHGSSPRIVSLNRRRGTYDFNDSSVPVIYPGLSRWFWTGHWPMSNYDAGLLAKFESTGGEVRPTNVAVRIWKVVQPAE